MNDYQQLPENLKFDEETAKMIRLKSDLAYAIGFCRGLGHPNRYLEKQYPDLIPPEKDNEDAS